MTKPTDTTVEHIKLMASRVRQAADELDSIAVKMDRTEDLEYASEALCTMTNLLQSTRLDLLVVSPLRELTKNMPSESQLLKEDDDVTSLGLTLRSYNILRQNGIKTISELTTYTVTDMLKLQYAGRKTVNEIRYALKNKGLHLHYDESFFNEKE